MSKSQNGKIANAWGGTAQGIADPKGKVRLAKLCFSGSLGSGLPPAKDCLKIGRLGAELLSVKVSKRQYRHRFWSRRKE